MSQSPETPAARPRYEGAWNAINRMIREEGSWGGRERNCFHLSCGDGRFVDLSYPSGADFIEDGRAFARLDIDDDGDDDLALRSRNGERLRILRNNRASAGAAPVVRVRLEGPIDGRDRVSADAVGARAELRGATRRSVRQVTIGSGFLSQSTRSLCFGVDGWEAPLELSVTWPNGAATRATVREGHEYVFRYGDPAPGERPLASPSVELPETAPAPVPLASERTATWLVSPVPAPLLPDGARGRTTLLLFLSKTCALCAGEIRAIERGAELLRRAGVTVIAWAIDEWSGERPRSFALTRADGETLAAWSVLHRELWDRRRPLAVPLGFLVDTRGLIQRAYRGEVDPATVAADARALPALDDRSARLARALPFAGTLAAARFERDHFRLGSAFDEAGLPAPALAAFRSYLEERPDDPDALYNLGRALSALGRRDEARRSYESATAIAPDHADALNNLGYIEATSGELESARRRFRRALDVSPAHPEASLNLAATHVEVGEIDAAVAVYRAALDADPENARLWSGLGFAQYRAGDLDAGIASYARARELSPRAEAASPEAREAAVGLANLLIMRGAGDDVERALGIVERALEHAPDDAPLLNAREQALRRLRR